MTKALNKEIEFITRANVLYNPIFPQPGVLLLGDKGVEYRSEKGKGYIQIPWSSIKEVRVQFFFKEKYVRGFFIETTDNQLFEFVVSEAKDCLKYMGRHLDRKQFKANPSNLKQVFRRGK